MLHHTPLANMPDAHMTLLCQAGAASWTCFTAGAEDPAALGRSSMEAAALCYISRPAQSHALLLL